mmetsp:Transcript_20825/g.30861  ORF Transcript_20825/g.30861 Transcript_20825/m.30861 type:complete len:205 (-) Transcript_20825:845-1459(-)
MLIEWPCEVRHHQLPFKQSLPNQAPRKVEKLQMFRIRDATAWVDLHAHLVDRRVLEQGEVGVEKLLADKAKPLSGDSPGIFPGLMNKLKPESFSHLISGDAMKSHHRIFQQILPANPYPLVLLLPRHAQRLTLRVKPVNLHFERAGAHFAQSLEVDVQLRNRCFQRNFLGLHIFDFSFPRLCGNDSPHKGRTLLHEFPLAHFII